MSGNQKALKGLDADYVSTFSALLNEIEYPGDHDQFLADVAAAPGNVTGVLFTTAEELAKAKLLHRGFAEEADEIVKTLKEIVAADLLGRTGPEVRRWAQQTGLDEEYSRQLPATVLIGWLLTHPKGLRDLYLNQQHGVRELATRIVADGPTERATDVEATDAMVPTGYYCVDGNTRSLVPIEEVDTGDSVLTPKGPARVEQVIGYDDPEEEV